MSMVFISEPQQASVTARYCADGGVELFYNLSDYKGDRPLKGARGLSPELKAALRVAADEAAAEEVRRHEALVASKREIGKVWRDDMIRYDDEPKGMIERTYAGINFAYAKDCIEFPTYQHHQFGKTMSGHAYDTRLSCYYGCLIDGGWAMDIHDLLDEKPGLAYSSPMLDTHSTAVSRFKDSAAAESWLLDVFASDEGNGFCGLAKLAKLAGKTDFGGFDYAPLSLWLGWWRDKCARIGRRQGNRVVWEDGTAEDIRPVELRWQCNR